MHERRVTPVLWDIWDEEFDDDVRCQFWTENSSRSGDIRLDSKILNFLSKDPYLVPFVLQLKKTYFEVRSLEVPRIAFQKVLSSAFPVFMTTTTKWKSNDIVSTACTYSFYHSLTTQDSHFVEFFLLYILVLLVCLRSLQNCKHMSGSFKTFPFYPMLLEIVSLKAIFNKK